MQIFGNKNLKNTVKGRFDFLQHPGGASPSPCKTQKFYGYVLAGRRICGGASLISMVICHLLFCAPDVCAPSLENKPIRSCYSAHFSFSTTSPWTIFEGKEKESRGSYLREGLCTVAGKLPHP